MKTIVDLSDEQIAILNKHNFETAEQIAAHVQDVVDIWIDDHKLTRREMMEKFLDPETVALLDQKEKELVEKYGVLGARKKKIDAIQSNIPLLRYLREKGASG